MNTIEKWLLLACVVVLAIIPFAFIAVSRATVSTTPRWAIVQDMDKQPHYKAQRANPFFADDRAMRPHIRHTIAREDLTLQDPANYQWHPNDANDRHIVLKNGVTYDRVILGQKKMGGNALWLMHPALAVNARLLARGHQRFVIYCSPCHGRSGYGDGMVQRTVERLRLLGDPNAGTWVNPANLHAKKFRALAVGQIYNVITNGFASMAGYKDQVPTADRWAIAAYVKSLQLSELPTAVDSAPPQVRQMLKNINPVPR